MYAPNTYDPAAVAMLNASELIAAGEKAANDWAFTPDAPELLDVTEQRDALRKLIEDTIYACSAAEYYDISHRTQAKLDEIMGVKR